MRLNDSATIVMQPRCRHFVGKWCNTSVMNEHREGLQKALIVIDMQNGVVEHCVHPKKVTARIQDMVTRARDTGTPVFWVQDERDFARHSSAWQMVEPLEPIDGEHRIFKSYRDAFSGTGLHAALNAANVNHVVVCGAQSDYCVRTAAQRAAAMGLDVTLVRDAHTTGAATFEGQTLTGDQVIAHTNSYFAGLDYPKQEIQLLKAEDVVFSATVSVD